jgi:uncharacterized CHY-type Zn-finger protein
MPEIKGKTVDSAGRCEHWHSELDIIAIKFACCESFYACFECHKEKAEHPAQRWPKAKFSTEKAIMCGVCKHEMTIQTYQESGSQCPGCGAPFNPRCSLHWPLYFEM